MNRKVFISTNTTLNCFGLCDPLCPFNCPNYNLSQPPLPPFTAENGSTQNHPKNHFIIIVLGVGSLLTGFFLLICFHVIRRWFRTRTIQDDAAGDLDEEFVDENQVDHPIWYIRTVGLQQSEIDSIPICKYMRGDRLIEATECSVCLNAFQDDEMLRLLPNCLHAFHISCIDTWLSSHTNCPLCRARIVIDTVR